MLRLENVKKQYQKFSLNCTMEVPTGCVTGLIGKNGAGKTTAFKAILGLIHKDAGDITVFGKPVEQLDQTDREYIGVVLADSGFSGYLTIKDLLPVLRNLYPKFQEEQFIAR